LYELQEYPDSIVLLKWQSIKINYYFYGFLFIRLARLLKVIKERSTLAKYVNAILKLSVAVERILFIGFMFIVLCHITTCMFYLLAKLEDFTPDTWVVRYGYTQHTAWDLYIVGFYWTVTTITTVGYGDINSANNSER